MANTKISNLTALTAPADDDVLPIVDTSAGSTKKIELDDLFIGRQVDIGTAGAAQLYVQSNAAGTIAIVANSAASPTAAVQEWQVNGTTRANMTLTATATTLQLNSNDNGANRGPRLYIDRNTNATTPAAGHVTLVNLGATAHRIWPDTAGLLRINGAADPTNANDTAGTVVGAQSSMAEAKFITAGSPDLREALNSVLDAAANGLRAFTYRSGAFNGEEFPNGLVTDYAPRYGLDRDAEHPQGKALNVPVAIGDLFASVSELHRRLMAVEAQVGIES